MKVTTIARNPANSPGMTNSDEAILALVEKELASMGHTVERIGEEQIPSEDTTIVCHMSRNRATLKTLKEAEAKGCIVLNTPTSVEHCSRHEQMLKLQENEILQPPFSIIANEKELLNAPFPGWLKKSTGWVQHKEEVSYVTGYDKASKALKKIKEYGCEGAIFSKHIEGDIIKFYGIEGGYFTYNYPNPEKSKFGLEKINGTPKGYMFNKEELRQKAFEAAKCLGLSIFGGDCIVTPKGEIYFIDINDFPSFAAVRETAAHHIAKLIVSKKRE